MIKVAESIAVGINIGFGVFGLCITVLALLGAAALLASIVNATTKKGRDGK